MTNKQFWMKMDQLSESKKLELSDKAFQLVDLLVQAYVEDLEIYISATEMPDGQFRQGIVCADPRNPNAPGSRFLLCYTSVRAGRSDPDCMGCYSVKLRDVLGNMVNKESIGGLIFNKFRMDDGSILIPKFMIGERLGKIPAPEGFVDNGGIWEGRPIK